MVATGSGAVDRLGVGCAINGSDVVVVVGSGVVGADVVGAGVVGSGVDGSGVVGSL